MSLWISHRYTYVPFLLNLPSTFHPILPSRLSQSTRFEHPTSYSKFPLATKFYPWQCICFSATPAVRPTLSFPLCVHSLFSMSVSHSVQFSSVTQSCPTLCDPMNRSTPGLPVHHQLPESPKPMSIELVMPSNHLILCHPLLLLPSIFPSITVFSNESALCRRWPKYWSFSFNISPTNKHPGLISFKMDWLDLLAVQGCLYCCSANKFISTIFQDSICIG